VTWIEETRNKYRVLVAKLLEGLFHVRLKGDEKITLGKVFVK
jgi:hypothetical protein